MLIKIKEAFNLSYQRSSSGAVALILVIMITALTIVSAVVISMVNTSNLMSAYYFSEVEKTSVDLDACLEDALFRLASSTTASGTYYLNGAGVNCYYQIASSISGGLKTVTSTASSTSDIGYWEDTIVMQINVSSSPISVYSYKNFDMSYASIVEGGSCTATCGNGAVECDEVCDDSNTTTESCGNGSTDVGKCNADCSAVVPDEVCDDGNTNTEACGDGVKQTGGAIYCNSTCTAVVTRNEACDYTGAEEPSDPGCYYGDVGCTIRYNGCRNSCTACAMCAIEL